MKKILLIFIFAIGLTSKASAHRDTVIYNGSTTVNNIPTSTMTVNVGDTIVFQSAMLYSINYLVHTTPFNNIFNTYFQYKVVGADVPSFTVTATYMTFTQPVITVYVNGTVGINEKTKTNNLTLFPNPTKNTFTVAGVKTANLSVYNQLGSLVKQQAFENETIALNIADLPQGIYMVEVWADGRRSLSKLVKE